MFRLKIFILVLFPALFFGQISSEKMALLKPLSNLDYAEASHVGVGGEESKIYNRFQKIKNNFTNQELFFLAKNSSNALRLYSSIELLKRNDPQILQLFEYYKKFTLKMIYKSGCTSKNISISESIIAEYKEIVYKKNELEELIKEIKDSEKSSELYIYYEKKLSEIAKITRPDFYTLYEKIKTIENKPNDFY